jgi:acyl-CoA thioesterase I
MFPFNLCHCIRRVILAGLALCGSILVLAAGCGRHWPASPGRDRIVYVALGASDAVGIGAFPLHKGYVYRIRDRLKPRAKTVELYNLGVAGAHVDDVERVSLATALARHPHVVTFWPGPNDLIHGVAVEEFEAALARVLSQLRGPTEAVIVVANVPDLTQIPRFRIEPDSNVTIERVRAYNDAIARQAALYAAPVADLFGGGYASDWEYVSLDGFHPSNAGHAKIAEVLLSIILQYF